MTSQEKEATVANIFAGRASMLKHSSRGLGQDMAATIIQRWARKHIIKKNQPQFEDSYEFRSKRTIAERHTIT